VVRIFEGPPEQKAVYHSFMRANPAGGVPYTLIKSWDEIFINNIAPFITEGEEIPKLPPAVYLESPRG